MHELRNLDIHFLRSYNDDSIWKGALSMIITSRLFGTTAEGNEVFCYDLKNVNGMVVSVLDYGCTIQKILFPDCRGVLTDVVLGYDSLDGYEKGNCYFGAVVGRYANRIRGARFWLNGKCFRLTPNDGGNHLHGVFSKTIFSASTEDDALVLRHLSPPEEEGFPGKLAVTVQYVLTDENELILDYEAETDADTVLNLTNHSYFNLNGDGDILGHSLRISAERFAECDAQTLPTRKLLHAEGTPMDFRDAQVIAETMNLSEPQLQLCGGYDHHYVLDHAPDALFPFAELIGDKSGIRMTASTTQPGVQLYTGNYVQNDTAPFGKGCQRYEKHAGLCLETQHAPDSPNVPAFPSTVLHPGERYHQKTVFQFHR